MEITPILQTHRTCGQTCIAMLAGITLIEAINIIGKTRATRTGDLKRGLDICGISHGDRLIRHKRGRPLPRLCICHFGMEIRPSMPIAGHWVVFHNGTFFDPHKGETFCETYPSGKLLSYLAIDEISRNKRCKFFLTSGENPVE